MSTLDTQALRLIGKKVLVKRYEKPEQVKGIFIPDPYRVDDTHSIYEWVKGSPEAVEWLGTEPQEGDILVTRPWAAVMFDREFGFLEVEQIVKVVAW